MVVGFGLLVTGLLTMVEMFPVARETADHGRDELVATHLAQAYLDQQMSHSYYAMQGGVYSDTQTVTLHGEEIDQTYETTVLVLPDGTNDLSASDKATVTVSVQWRARSFSGQTRYRNVQVETVRVREF